MKEGTGLTLGVTPTMLSLHKLEGPFIGNIRTYMDMHAHVYIHTLAKHPDNQREGSFKWSTKGIDSSQW